MATIQPVPQTKYTEFRVTVDAAIFCCAEGVPHVLLIQRDRDPYKGAWCLPGGHVDAGDEDLCEAALRELREETGLTLAGEVLQQVGAFGRDQRDPRGRYVTIAFTTSLGAPHSLPRVSGADDARDAKWWPLSALPPLGFDHGTILAHAATRALGGPQWPRRALDLKTFWLIVLVATIAAVAVAAIGPLVASWLARLTWAQLTALFLVPALAVVLGHLLAGGLGLSPHGRK